ncbi:MAG: beta-ketoacyl-[acyl-carrier-protein] synthase family protein [Desulfobacteraceae bacterium]|nr:beta-ketoacyl-[acyl-carrier-protein] synthase family protein [Desulfobacteraceae bacterium]MBC2718612.1 beta-ketoacyl-[acyl-carrier-protein] synthase family protein [Desulfobacteraceae bacterium]
MKRRVVVTGLNMITPLGLNLETSWDNFVAGKNGISLISLFDTSNHMTKIAGELSSDFENYSKKSCKKYLSKKMGRATKICYVCAKEAVESSGIDFKNYDAMRCSVILGANDTGHSRIYHNNKNWLMKTMVNGMAAWISITYKIEGPCFTIATACSSSAYAIGYGYDLIRSNMADVVIVGGAGSIVNPEHLEGFNEVYALSTSSDIPEKASRPFSIDRDGFVLGEGAGILILEDINTAKKRGAYIYAEMIGHALTSEAYNIMSPKRDGSGMAKTMDLALKKSKIKKEEVDYINAHGTSTPHNDRVETLAIKKVFGKHACDIPVSSSKSMIGHTASACGGIEAVLTIMSIKNGMITPTINYHPDPELDLDYVPNIARKQKIDVAISNSFAFGGHNATLVFKKY